MNRYPHIPWSGFNSAGLKKVPVVGEIVKAFYGEDLMIIFTGSEQMPVHRGEQKFHPLSTTVYHYIFLDRTNEGEQNFFHEGQDPGVINLSTYVFRPL